MTKQARNIAVGVAALAVIAVAAVLAIVLTRDSEPDFAERLREVADKGLIGNTYDVASLSAEDLNEVGRLACVAMSGHPSSATPSGVAEVEYAGQLRGGALLDVQTIFTIAKDTMCP